MRKGSGIKEKDDGSGISGPTNVQIRASMSADMNWSVSSPDELFILKNQIGRGAFGTVYQAEFKSGGYPIAVKKVQEDKSTIATIKKEVDILKKSNSPFIVNYFGSVEGSSKTQPIDKKGKTSTESLFPDGDDKSIYILMDYCGGGSVRDYIESQGTLNEEQIGSILLSVVQGLAFLHTHKIIHRDLKTANILMTKEGKVKLADFGISTQLDATVTGIATGKVAKTMIGTTYWMAPEISSEKYDYKIDLWSLGITIIEMATSEPPFFNLKPFQFILQLPKLAPALPEVNKANQHFTPQLRDLVAQCLQHDPTKRPTATKLLEHAFFAKKGLKESADLVVAVMATSHVYQKK